MNRAYVGAVIAACLGACGDATEDTNTPSAPSSPAAPVTAEPTAPSVPPADSAPSGTAWAQAGLGEPVIDNAINKPGWTVDTQLDHVLALRPHLFRLWMPAGYLYSASGQPMADYLPLYRRAIDRLRAAGVEIMGMDHSFPPWMTGAESDSANWNTIPCVDTSAGAPYLEFLDRYEQHWARMAQWFPEIAIWEPANETNGRESLKPIQRGAGSCGKPYFTFDERVFITIQLMERAHRAIHSIRPSSSVFLAPPSPILEDNSVDTSLVSIQRFLRAIYGAIASWCGSARSYFDGVSWHPYIFQLPTLASWILPNEAIHQVMTDYGDGQLPVVFSEVGNSEMNFDPSTGGLVARSATELASWMQEAFRLSQKDSPWLQHIVWFRAFDDAAAVSWGGEHQRRFGILQEDYPNFTVKPSADVFCKFSGCVDEPFKAWLPNVGWSTFGQSGHSYCQYRSPQHFTALTGLPYDESLPYLPALGTTGMTYVGNCAGAVLP